MKKGQKEYKQNKPLYYNEYIYDDENKNTENYKYYNNLFLILSGIFIFLFSVLDIIYSYISVDKCQTLETSSISLNNWLCTNGIFGLCYYFLMIIFYYTFYVSEEKQKGYHLLVNRDSKEEKCETLYKSLSIFFTIIMLLLFSVGSCIYFSFFNHLCESYFIIIYMWIRLLSGLITSLLIIVFIVL